MLRNPRRGILQAVGKLLPVGLFLLVTCVYVISGPGRMDMIDGQYRYDVTRNIVERGSPTITDNALPPTPVGRGGRRFFLGPTPSLIAVPLVAVGVAIDAERPQLHEFLFSFTSAFVAAFGAVALFAIYVLLGVSRRRAVGWTLVTAFATYTWPIASSTFDQAQQATILLIAAWTALLTRGDRMRYAVVSGFAASVLVTYQEAYLVLVPAIALLSRGEGESLWTHVRHKRTRWFALGFAIGYGALVIFNYWRFGGGSVVTPQTHGEAASLLGNPFVGAAALLVSPGKSVLLYSPPVALAVVGLTRLWKEQRAFVFGILAVVGAHFGLVSCLSFFAGDWAWGPRYLAVTLPLVAIGLPFARVRKPIAIAVISLGVVVQLLGLSVDHQRWFFERGLADNFWAKPAIYFKTSPLLSRPGELLAVLELDAHDISSRRFAPNPYRSPTYAAFGNGDRTVAPQWMRQFAMFYVPRPWPLWMSRLRDPPVGWKLGVALCLAGMLAGAGLLMRGLRATPSNP